MTAAQCRAWGKIIAIGILAFVALALRFSPNWATYYNGYVEARALAKNAEQSAAVDRAFLSAYNERGYYVLQQARDLSAEIDTPIHKIVRWRLLIPAIAHGLRLPVWATLGLAHFGALILVVLYAAVGYSAAPRPQLAIPCALAIAVIGGASVPFFTSMGWLGYYDGWLAIGLLAAALAPRRWVVIAACVLTPWIDERFVVALPLALLVRWQRAEEPTASLGKWFKTEALFPLLIVVVYAIVRLRLAGTGGSQTVGQYSNLFLKRFDITFSQRLRGAWEGLRFGWVLIALAVAGAWFIDSSTKRRIEVTILLLAIATTATVGLFTALDMSRSMTLLVPAVAWGAITWQRSSSGQKPQWLLVLALTALALPAYQVVGITLVPVGNIRSNRLRAAQNALGVIYDVGKIVSRNPAVAAQWYRKAADQDYPYAQRNLAALYLSGEGVPVDPAQALHWFLRAAAGGSMEAQNDLGVMFTQGRGVAKDWITAYSWFFLAASRGNVNAAKNADSLRPYITAEQVALGEARAREFVAANPRAKQLPDEPTPPLPR